ncbi:MAG: ArnT family glycosyltransferase [Bacteroidia bacterium]
MNRISIKHKIAGYFFMAIILYFVFFQHLSSFHIRTWDESIYSVEAYEMLQDGNYLVPHNNGFIDYTHAKPLLAVWLQVLSIKLFGFNELAVRLPSALAGAFCCLLLFFFMKKHFNETVGWCVFLTLASSRGFVYFHTARTADTDSTLTLFLLLSNFHFLFYLIEGKGKNLFYYFIFLSLAFLTKSFAALLFIPGHFILLLLEKKVIAVLKKKEFYFGSLLFLLLSLSYVFARQKADPGYINTVISSDLARVGSAIENHREPFYYYLDNFISWRFSFWLFPFMACILYTFVNWHSVSIILKWSAILTLTYFLVISISGTKLEWYDMPLYPHMCISVGFIIHELIDKITKRKIAFTLVVFTLPVYSIIKQSYANSMNGWDYVNERGTEYLFEKTNQGADLNNLAIADTSFNGPFLFYKYRLKEVNQNIRILKPEEIKINDKVLVTDPKIKTYIRKKFNVSVADSLEEAIVFEIKAELSDTAK